ncbi:hypothetical protein RBB68_00660 [Leptospira interrogans]|uniref:Uncharacterized protein n=16 Tax=Leptospira interrogans TaxID=173 RepID=Q8F9P8_LEPIN|nr:MULTISPECIES: hypothetical protein [Leptospira]APH40139.1 Uncharacterized protein A9P81_0165 [Leptospira interrogans serovar Copenhageni/Icterohaemorrhagiae]EMF43445.1 hypothetical protein LEP1GSC067_1378 [Leptospira interrogans serovar Lora str. TE 1992]EMG22764.1 hypothetical protein LEP1GSC150_4890 [Leptospira interrogans serovar Copenhageni str. LT2050]EMM83344.1 hypothetical protein LEP1GSC037_2411 [Leptospira interrogans str. 2006001854]EMN31379.1 hypothetical protein LEP1GSC083_3792 
MKIGGEHKVQLGIPRDESLYYIGHGQLESAPASTSVLHVISHELGHVAEFKSEALRDRAEIRSLNMKIHYEFRNGKLVAVAGETEVVTAKKSEETLRKDTETSQQESLKEKDFPKKEETSKTKSEDREKQILSEIRRIESELKIFETKKDVEEKGFDSIRKTELEEKKRKLEMVLSQEKLKAVLKDTMDTFKELMDKQTRMSLKIFNTNVSDKLGNFLDARI